MTTVAIHQPEHFPYMGFFQKMQNCDVFVILDNVKFKKNDFQNRNKILLNGKEEWITVPVEKDANSKEIREVQTATLTGKQSNWRKNNLEKIERAYGKVYTKELENIYSYHSLSSINISSIELVRDVFQIHTPLVYASSLNVTGTKTQLLYNIVKNLGGKRYLSGQGGKDYLDISQFIDIHVDFFEPKVENYLSSLHNICVW